MQYADLVGWVWDRGSTEVTPFCSMRFEATQLCLQTFSALMFFPLLILL